MALPLRTAINLPNATSSILGCIRAAPSSPAGSTSHIVPVRDALPVMVAAALGLAFDSKVATVVAGALLGDGDLVGALDGCRKESINFG